MAQEAKSKLLRSDSEILLLVLVEAY
jgi:hypothetical protein